jgi:hypothetical protein
MTKEQVRSVVKRYRAYLSLAGDQPELANFDLPPTRGEAVRHMLNMCDGMDGMLDKVVDPPCFTAESEEAWQKVHRWVGFMQGVLWAHGSFSMNEMREHNTCSPSS